MVTKKKTEIYVFIYPTHCCAKHCLLVSIKPNGRKSKRTSVLYSNDKTDIVAITAIGSESEFLRGMIAPSSLDWSSQCLHQCGYTGYTMDHTHRSFYYPAGKQGTRDAYNLCEYEEFKALKLTAKCSHKYFRDLYN